MKPGLMLLGGVLVLMGLGGAGLGWAQGSRAVTVVAASPAVTVENMQGLLQATEEEWSVIYPQLEEVTRMREEVNANVGETGGGGGSQGTFLSGMMNAPLGGTSMDVPNVPASMNLMGKLMGNSPFDPSAAPGNGPSRRRTAARGNRSRTLEFLRTDKGNSVLVQLTELQALLAVKETTTLQLREKLAAVRAARQKAMAALEREQQELRALLTLEQQAILVSLGYLD